MKFKKKQLEKLLAGEINPTGKLVNKSLIKEILIPINNALKNATKPENEIKNIESYDEPLNLKKQAKAEKVLGIRSYENWNI